MTANKAPLDPAFLTSPLTHRGLHNRDAGVIENSRAAIMAAIDAGYGIEIDIQQTADDQPLVFHDYNMKRLAAHDVYVRTLPLAEVTAIPLTDGPDGPPPLGEVLEMVAGRVPLLIEIKDQHGALGPVDGVLEGKVANTLSGYNGPVALMSFNPHSVAACATAAPHIPRGRVSDPFWQEDWAFVPAQRRAELAKLDDLPVLGASFTSHYIKDLTSPAIAAVKASGLPVLCWTVRSEAEEKAAREVADNITFEGYLPTGGQP
ncbi:MAG: glycerophosphodiester phosphodiesterase family protein [Pikeienuella sp.]